MKDLLYKIWQSPKWIHYSVAVLTIGLAIILRLQFHSLLGDNARYIFFTIPIALSAFLGGILPGIFAMSLAVLGGTVLLPRPSSQFLLDPVNNAVQITTLAVTWLILCVICDMMRSVAFKYRRATYERDSTLHKLDDILASISDGFVSVDNDWRIVHTNHAFEEMMGKETPTIVGRLIWDVSDGNQGPLDRLALEKVKRAGQVVTQDVLDPTGRHWYHVRAFPHSDGIFLFVQDVTARKEIELNRERMLANERRARSDAEAASRMKDEFVATVSHELRSPLTTILGWSEILQKREWSDPQAMEGLLAIERSTRLQAQLIEDLLDVSRMATGKLRLDVHIVDMREVVRDSVSSGQPAAEAGGVRLASRMPEEAVFIRGDEARLAQVVSNLVSNAVKFTPNGGEVTVSLSVEGPQAVVKVTDTGVGIDPALLGAIFNRFRQADASSTRKHGGLGLGLAIAKQLTELHGGSIEAFSAGPGKGTEMNVRLPVASSQPRNRNGTPDPDVHGSPTIRGVKVLVVDDDEDTRSLLSVALDEAGAEVRTARSAAEALKLIEGDPPDVLLSDVGMPEMDGHQLIHAIRAMGTKLHKRLPAVALTAFARVQDKERALEAGFDDHLSKPVDIAKLVSTIATLNSSGSLSPTGQLGEVGFEAIDK